MHVKHLQDTNTSAKATTNPMGNDAFKKLAKKYEYDWK